jgi:hypothetical protein
MRAPLLRLRDLTALGEAIYARLGPVAVQDEALGWPLLTLVQALAEMARQVEELVRPADIARHAWDPLLDVDLSPDWNLPYLGQFVGVRVTPGATPAQARAQIKAEGGFQRGTPAAMVAAVRATLVGTQYVFLKERDGDEDHITVVTRTRDADPGRHARRGHVAEGGRADPRARRDDGADVRREHDARADLRRALGHVRELRRLEGVLSARLACHFAAARHPADRQRRHRRCPARPQRGRRSHRCRRRALRVRPARLAAEHRRGHHRPLLLRDRRARPGGVVGVLYRDAGGATPTWTAVNPGTRPLVTSLPGSPVDGQEVIYQADVAGTYGGPYNWPLRYRSACRTSSPC